MTFEVALLQQLAGWIARRRDPRELDPTHWRVLFRRSPRDGTGPGVEHHSRQRRQSLAWLRELGAPARPIEQDRPDRLLQFDDPLRQRGLCDTNREAARLKLPRLAAQ